MAPAGRAPRRKNRGVVRASRGGRRLAGAAPRDAWLACALLLAACAPGGGPDAGGLLPDGGGFTEDAGPHRGDGGGDGGGIANSDAERFWEALAGERTVDEMLLEVARHDGWPIATPEGFIFAHKDDGMGPYRLAGDHDGWRGTPMQLEHGVWWTQVRIDAPRGSKYKFIDGQGRYVADPWARRYGYDAFGQYALVRAWGGHIERWPGVAGEGLAPRTVRVWVPMDPPTHHLYMHDGQNIFDRDAPFGGWKIDEVVSSSTLVVGIDNTPDRMDEYTHVPDRIEGEEVGGRADAYARFVREVVVPLVEAEYGPPERRGVMGSSLGGLVSLYIAVAQPDFWDFAGSLSGTLGWGSIGAHNETVIERYVAAGPMPFVLYLDSGGGPGSGCVDSDGDGIRDDAPDSQDNYCTTRQMADELAAGAWTYDVNLFHWWEPGAGHHEAAWAARVFRPVGLFEGL
ncbi:MAG: hypothetical protein D6729_09890 [Deltaproteobacteria bacterium]|nr:MAG: hypothetical protein D6729_09890 [Deltaproteobacteria bacterium]